MVASRERPTEPQRGPIHPHRHPTTRTLQPPHLRMERNPLLCPLQPGSLAFACIQLWKRQNCKVHGPISSCKEKEEEGTTPAWSSLWIHSGGE